MVQTFVLSSTSAIVFAFVRVTDQRIQFVTVFARVHLIETLAFKFSLGVDPTLASIAAVGQASIQVAFGLPQKEKNVFYSELVDLKVWHLHQGSDQGLARLEHRGVELL